MASSELNELFREAMRFAKHMLIEHGDFIPFGVSMDDKGDMAQVGATLDDEHPASADVVDLLQDVFQREAARGSIIAAGVCIDMLVRPPRADAKSDAVCVRLAHISGETAVVYVPYTLPEPGKLVLGTIFRSREEGFRLTPQARSH